MTIHYHGTPITPRSKLLELKGNNFCVSWNDPRDVVVCHKIGQQVLLDNGAYTFWRTKVKPDWRVFYAWAIPWLECPTTNAIIPDVISGTEWENDALIPKNLDRHKWWPVWHIHESFDRLARLAKRFNTICFGSSGEFSIVGTLAWRERVRAAFDFLKKTFGTIPRVHMLRGMKACTFGFPFYSLDSADVAINHHLTDDIVAKAARWNGVQCSGWPWKASINLCEA